MISAPRVGIVGIHGHGRSHVEAVLAAERRGRLALAAVADPLPPDMDSLPPATAYHESADGMLAAGDLDVVIVSTPIHTHAALAVAAVESGADVLLEKPPTATMAEFDDLSSAADRAGRLVQVGFQSLGSSAVAAMRREIAAGRIGEVTRYGASAGWVRDFAYWDRARWAGARRLDGRVVADGVLTNPLAHATATALAVAGATSRADVTAVDLDLHHAYDIDADDTSVARLALADGRRLTTAVTLCAADREEPYIEVVGDRGRVRFYYAMDIVQWSDADGGAPFTVRYDRVPLLDDLLEARRTGRAPIAPLRETGGFMRLLEAVMAAPDPVPIDRQHWNDVSDERGRHRVVSGVERALHEAVSKESTFSELGVPWARI